jgi:N-carbamoyl-L-amino-acid hydrolase
MRLGAMEDAFAAFPRNLPARTGVTVSVERLARFEPVRFGADIVRRVEQDAKGRALSCRRMTSGAGHHAQMIARIAPAAMIFIPSVTGVSHRPKESTAEADLVAGAGVLLDVIPSLASEPEVDV